MAHHALIIYDLDGTLVDTKRDIADAAHHMLAELHLPTVPDATIWRYVGRGLSTLVADCLQTDDPQQIDAGMRIYRAYYSRHMLDHTQLYPGAQEVLDHFQDRRQVVITNKPNPYAREILEGLGVARYFAQIIAGNSDFPKKPDPAAVLAVIARAGAAPSGTLLIGDSAVDIDTGRRAHIMTIGVSQGFAVGGELAAAKPDVLVENFSALLALAQQESW